MAVIRVVFFIATVFWMVVFSPPLVMIVWLGDSYDNQHPIIRWFGLPYLLLWFMGCPWLGMRTAHHILDDSRGFLEAAKYTLYDLKLRLAFVPLIGALFTPDEDKTQNDGDSPTE